MLNDIIGEFNIIIKFKIKKKTTYFLPNYLKDAQWNCSLHLGMRFAVEILLILQIVEHSLYNKTTPISHKLLLHIFPLYIYIYIYTHTCCHHLPSPLYCLGQSCFPLPRFAWCLLAHAASFHLIHLRHVILKIQGCYPLTLPDVLTLHLRIKRKLKWANFIVWTVV